MTDLPNAKGSKLFFGAPNHDYFTGELTWIKITSESYWNLEATGITKNGKEVQGIPKFNAIMDSGTSLIVVMPEIYKHWEIKPLTDNKCPTNTDDLPTIGITIGGKNWELTPKQYIIKVQDQCVLGIQAGQIGNIQMIIGDTFMKHYYTHFDYANDRLAIAKAIPHDGLVRGEDM
jgi:hypothetical protein